MLPLYLIQIVSNILGFVGQGFVNSSKGFQVICQVATIVLIDKNKLIEKKRKLAKGRALAQKKSELRRTKENIKYRLN